MNTAATARGPPEDKIAAHEKNGLGGPRAVAAGRKTLEATRVGCATSAGGDLESQGGIPGD